MGAPWLFLKYPGARFFLPLCSFEMSIISYHDRRAGYSWFGVEMPSNISAIHGSHVIHSCFVEALIAAGFRHVPESEKRPLKRVFARPDTG